MEKSTQIFTKRKTLKEVSHCICLLVNSQLSSILFLEQVIIVILKCFQKNVNILLKKKKKMPECITDDIGTSSDDFDREDSDEETYNEENSYEENSNGEN